MLRGSLASFIPPLPPRLAPSISFLVSATSPVYSLSTVPIPEPGVSYYAVLGHPVGHSLSPAMQQAALDALEMPGRYVAIELTREEFPRGIARLGALGYAGWNVTVPHKLAMFERVDRREPSAAQAGAVNTVVRDGFHLVGHSTDGPGWESAVGASLGFTLKDRGLLILGAGGSGQTLLLHAAAAGARVFLANRTEAKAEALLDGFAARGISAAYPPQKVGWEACSLAEVAERVDLIVNTTSSGLKEGEASPVPASVFRSGLLAYDLIYRPAVTPFLQAAAEGGARGANGLSMLLHQGFLAFRLWHPALSPAEASTALAAMRGALEAATGQTLSPT